MDQIVIHTVAAVVVAAALSLPFVGIILLSVNFIIGCVAKCADLYGRWRTRKHVA